MKHRDKPVHMYCILGMLPGQTAFDNVKDFLLPQTPQKLFDNQNK